MSLKQVLRNVYSQWSLQAIRAAISFTTAVVVARILGPERYGAAMSVVVFSLVFRLVLNPGFTLSAIRHISVYKGSGRDYTPLVAGYLLYRLAAGIPLAALFYLASGFFASLAGVPQYADAYRVYSVSIALMAFYEAMRAYLHGIGRVDMANLYFTISFVTASISSLALVLQGLGVYGYVLGLVVGNALHSAIYALTLRDCLRACARAGVRGAVEGLKIIAPLGMSVLATQVANFLHMWLDKAVVLGLLGVHSLGLYSVALKLAGTVDAAKNAVTVALRPYYGTVYGASGLAPIRSKVFRASKVMSLAFAPPVLVLAGLAPALVSAVYGPEYADAWPIVAVHLAYTAATSFTAAYGGIPLILEARREIVGRSVVSACTSLALELGVVTLGLGGLGVVLGRDLGALAAFLYVYLALYRRLRLEFDSRSWLLGTIMGASMLAVTALVLLLAPHIWYLAPLVAALVYVGIAKLLKPLDRADMRVVREALGAKFSKFVEAWLLE